MNLDECARNAVKAKPMHSQQVGINSIVCAPIFKYIVSKFINAPSFIICSVKKSDYTIRVLEKEKKMFHS